MSVGNFFAEFISPVWNGAMTKAKMKAIKKMSFTYFSNHTLSLKKRLPGTPGW